MTHKFFQFAWMLLATWWATAAIALGQPFTDPGFGDPTTLTPPTTAFLPTPGLSPNGGLPGGTLPMAPNQPGSPVRPNTWPGGAPSPVPGYAPPLQAGMPPASGYRVATSAPTASTPNKKSPADPPYDPAEILARIGSERVQACEVLPMINRAINNAVNANPQFAQLTPEERQTEIYKAQKSFLQMALKEMINTKLLVAEFRAAADPKALVENEKRIRDFFNSDHLKNLQQEYEAASVIDLENKLRALGGSIESQRALFVEQNLAAGWLGQAVKKVDKEPTHDEMLEYYRKHGDKWDNPARARWEQLSAKWSSFNARNEAIAALAGWGDDVLVRGVPLAQVAKAHSQDFAADDGGVHDWATRGSLRSTAIDAALFTLPVGTLSRIVEDEEGCHILRVLEREDAHRTPFTEVQKEIKQQLHDGGEAQRRKEYLEKLLETTPVWTVFDEEPGGPVSMTR